jgi:hypothetical protein
MKTQHYLFFSFFLTILAPKVFGIDVILVPEGVKVPARFSFQLRSGVDSQNNETEHVFASMDATNFTKLKRADITFSHNFFPNDVNSGTLMNAGNGNKKVYFDITFNPFSSPTKVYKFEMFAKDDSQTAAIISVINQIKTCLYEIKYSVYKFRTLYFSVDQNGKINNLTCTSAVRHQDI